MAGIKRFEDLDAWLLARQLTNRIYDMARVGPFASDFGLRNQICRAAVSVMSNIAEGFERDGDREFVNFLSIAKGSAGETRSLLYVAFDQGYISEADFNSSNGLAVECSRVISGLSTYLKQSELKGRKFK